MFLVSMVCQSVCLFVSEQHYSKSYERIAMKFYGGVWGDKKELLKFWWRFGSSLKSK